MALGTHRSYNFTDDGEELARLRFHAGIKKGDTTFDVELKELAGAESAAIDRELTAGGAESVPLDAPIPIEILTAEAERAGGIFRENRWGAKTDQPRTVAQQGQAQAQVIEGSVTRRRGEKRTRDYIQNTYRDDPDATSPTGVFEAIEDTPRWK